LEETDQHLLFLCAFARAAWYLHPWNLRIDQIVSPDDSISQILTRLISMNHPYGSLENILTFMWCLWKSRNDCLFNKKDNTPLQVHHMTNAIKQNLKLLDTLPDYNQKQMYRRSLLIKGTQSGQICRFKGAKSSRMQHGKKGGL
jgi:hypothetical protein